MSDEVVGAAADDTPSKAWERFLRSRQIPPARPRPGRAPALNPAKLNYGELSALMRSFGPARDRVRALEAELSAARPVVGRITAALTAARERQATVERVVREALVHRAAGGGDGE